MVAIATFAGGFSSYTPAVATGVPAPATTIGSAQPFATGSPGTDNRPHVGVHLHGPSAKNDSQPEMDPHLGSANNSASTAAQLPTPACPSPPHAAPPSDTAA